MESKAMHKFSILLLALITSHLVLSVQAGRQIKSVSKTNGSKQTSHTDISAMFKETHNQPTAQNYIPNEARHSVLGKQILPPPTAPKKTLDFVDSVEREKDTFIATSAAVHGKDHNQPTAPTYIPDEARHSVIGKQILPPPPAPTKTSDFGESVEREKDDSRPTTPGVHGNHHNQPTSPCYIPNEARHSVLGKQILPPPTALIKTSDFGDSVGEKSAFRPTTPGKSPGVGHSYTEYNEQKSGSTSSSNVKQYSVAGGTEDFRPTNPGHSPGAGHAFQQKSEPNA